MHQATGACQNSCFEFQTVICSVRIQLHAHFEIQSGKDSWDILLKLMRRCMQLVLNCKFLHMVLRGRKTLSGLVFADSRLLPGASLAFAASSLRPRSRLICVETYRVVNFLLRPSSQACVPEEETSPAGVRHRIALAAVMRQIRARYTSSRVCASHCQASAERLGHCTHAVDVLDLSVLQACRLSINRLM